MTFPKQKTALQILQLVPLCYVNNNTWNSIYNSTEIAKITNFTFFHHFVTQLFSLCYGNKNTSSKWQWRYAFFYLYPWEAPGICYSIFTILLEIYRFKLLKLSKNFVVANQFLNWISRLKSDYDDVVKKNQELENRILQLVMLLPFWSNRRPLIHDWNYNFWLFLSASSTGFQ